MEDNTLAELYKQLTSGSNLGWLAWRASDRSDDAVPAYICPSEAQWNEFPTRRTYFGVSGGSTITHTFSSGDVYRDGIMFVNSFVRVANVRDGTSRTMAFGESSQSRLYGMGDGYGNDAIGGPVWWFSGDQLSRSDLREESPARQVCSTKYPPNAHLPMATLPENDYSFFSPHAGGVFFAFCDGHVEFIADEIATSVYRALSTRSGGEIMDSY
jgi:prepilin-type processing-associated H-X9-DG protein